MKAGIIITKTVKYPASQHPISNVHLREWTIPIQFWGTATMHWKTLKCTSLTARNQRKAFRISLGIKATEPVMCLSELYHYHSPTLFLILLCAISLPLTLLITCSAEYPYWINTTLGGGRRYARGTGLHAVAILVVIHCQCIHVLVLISLSIFCDAILHAAIFIFLLILCYVPHLLISDCVLLNTIYCNEAS